MIHFQTQNSITYFKNPPRAVPTEHSIPDTLPETTGSGGGITPVNIW